MTCYPCLLGKLLGNTAPFTFHFYTSPKKEILSTYFLGENETKCKAPLLQTSYFYSVETLGACILVEGLMRDREEIAASLLFSFIRGDAQLQIRMSVNGGGLGVTEDTEVSGA